MGTHDYFLSKRFDADRDGRLNTKERRTVLSALRSGYEDRFRWNLEAAGPHLGSRLIQVRGRIVEAEDFSTVRNTYPMHPLAGHTPHVSSLSDLRVKRKEGNVEDMRRGREKWEKSHPVTMPVQFVQSEFLVPNPL